MKNCGIKLLPEEQKDIAEMLEYIAVTLCAPTAALKLYNVLLTQFQRLKSFPIIRKRIGSNQRSIKLFISLETSRELFSLLYH